MWWKLTTTILSCLEFRHKKERSCPRHTRWVKWRVRCIRSSEIGVRKLSFCFLFTLGERRAWLMLCPTASSPWKVCSHSSQRRWLHFSRKPVSFFAAFHPSRRVLVPGTGLSRLLLEVVERGYGGQGNEFSYQMLLVSNYMLNHVFEAKSVAMMCFCEVDPALSLDGQHEQHLLHGRQ